MAKPASLDDLDGVIVKNRVGYTLNKLGVKKPITRVKLVELVESIDVEAHNKEYLSKLKKQLETYDKDGYNVLGFNKDGIHRNGTEFSDDGYNAKGWIKVEYKKGMGEKREKLRDVINPKNAFTGTILDMDGYDKDGYGLDGYNKDGYDREGYNREGINDKGFNREGNHKDTNSQYAPDGFTEEGIDNEGYNREGENKRGKTREEVAEQKDQQTSNFLGLLNLAKGYSEGTITIEDYLKNHKITIEELIDFAKKQKMDKDIVLGLYKKKKEYYTYSTRFDKANYLKTKTTINGVLITGEIVDKVVAYLKANNRLLSSKIVNDHIKAYANGQLKIGDEKTEENENVEGPTINEFGEIIRPNNDKTFSTVDVGKATINAPTSKKLEADKTKEQNIIDKDKTNENEGESIDDN